MTNKQDFQEVGHCGGKVTISVSTSSQGRRQVQLGVTHSAPTPASWFLIYATLDGGVPVATVRLLGMGQPSDPPMPDGCVPIFIASDVQSMWGHQCPRCNGYWRSSAAPSDWRMTCAYCGLRAPGHAFRTDGQRHYVGACCERINEFLDGEDDGDFVIDMDVVADAVGKDLEKPPFYYAEQSQQNEFVCEACRARNDILGRYGYCCSSGTQ